MKGKPNLHILCDYQLNIYLTVDLFVFPKYIRPANFRIWPPNVFKGLTQNSVPKLKVMRQFYVDSENKKKY